GSGGNTVSAAAVTGTNRVVLIGGAGVDNFTGGAGNHIFKFAAASLATTDAIKGGAGTDELLMTTAGTINAGGISGVETYVLASGGANTLSLANANFTGVAGATITIDDGNGGTQFSGSGLSA